MHAALTSKILKTLAFCMACRDTYFSEMRTTLLLPARGAMVGLPLTYSATQGKFLDLSGQLGLPSTTAILPETCTSLRWSSSMQPAGVQGTWGNWVAVREHNFSYYIRERILDTMYIPTMVLNLSSLAATQESVASGLVRRACIDEILACIYSQQGRVWPSWQ